MEDLHTMVNTVAMDLREEDLTAEVRGTSTCRKEMMDGMV
jgi:hypothetical protein